MFGFGDWDQLATNFTIWKIDAMHIDVPLTAEKLLDLIFNRKRSAHRVFDELDRSSDKTGTATFQVAGTKPWGEIIKRVGCSLCTCWPVNMSNGKRRTQWRACFPVAHIVRMVAPNDVDMKLLQNRVVKDATLDVIFATLRTREHRCGPLI